MTAILRTSFALVLVGAVTAASGPASNDKDAVRRLLTSTFKVSDSEFERIDRGNVVTRTLGANDPREVGTVGIVRLRIAPAVYAERVADIARFKKDDDVLQIGVFRNPPQLADLNALMLDEADVRSLRNCRVRDCDVQLSAEAITRFRSDVDWRRADAFQQANGLMRQILVDYVAAYQKNGTSMQYADRPEPIDLRGEFASLAQSELGGCPQLATLRRHLFEYPAASTPGTTDLIYWSKEKVSRRTVVSVTHLTISRTAADSLIEYAIASRQIYGTHYFDSSLGVTMLLPDRSAPAPATYLVYVNRSRIDIFGGVLGGVVRKVVSSRARSTVSDHLTKLQRTFDREAAAALVTQHPSLPSAR
jgi:hypothetical protein